MKTKYKLLSLIVAFSMLSAGAVAFTGCGESDGPDPKPEPGPDPVPSITTPSTKEEWQAQWATYTYSKFAEITDWDSKTVTYQFSSLDSAFVLGDEIGDITGLDEDSYVAVQEGATGPGEDPTYVYYEKDTSVQSDGLSTGEGKAKAHILLNFYSDYSVQIVQTTLNATVAYTSYGIWDLKAGMGGDYSLKLYYLNKDAAADTTTEVNDQLASLDGRYAVELHDVGDNTGTYWIEPSGFRPLVLFDEDGVAFKSDAYITQLSSVKYNTVSAFVALSKASAEYTKEDWQAQWATYTYSAFAAIDDWDSKDIVYQFSSLDSAFVLGDEIADVTGVSDYVAVQQGPAGPGQDPVYKYYAKDTSVQSEGLSTGEGKAKAHVLLNFYADYSVRIIQVGLDGSVVYNSYGIWDLKAGSDGAYSLKLYYLNKDAAADTTTEVNDQLASLDGRYAVELHDVGDNTGTYWIEPSGFRPLVLFDEDGVKFSCNAYIDQLESVAYETVAEFADAVKGE